MLLGRIANVRKTFFALAAAPWVFLDAESQTSGLEDEREKKSKFVVPQRNPEANKAKVKGTLPPPWVSARQTIPRLQRHQEEGRNCILESRAEEVVPSLNRIMLQ